MRFGETIAYSLLGRLKKSRPIRKLKKSLKRPVIVLTPGVDRRRFLERAGKYSTVVARNGHHALFVFILIGLLATACSPGEVSTDLDLPSAGLTAVPGSADLVTSIPGIDPTETPAAVLRAVNTLSTQTGVAVQDIEIVEYEQVDWSNACLGLAQEGEMCAEVITPGFRVVLEANGQQYELHTDNEGTTIRQR